MSRCHPIISVVYVAPFDVAVVTPAMFTAGNVPCCLTVHLTPPATARAMPTGLALMFLWLDLHIAIIAIFYGERQVKQAGDAFAPPRPPL